MVTSRARGSSSTIIEFEEQKILFLLSFLQKLHMSQIFKDLDEVFDRLEFNMIRGGEHIYYEKVI